MSAASMLAEARKWIGTRGRPNTLTRAYASRHGAAFASAPWCDIAVTEWARRSGNHAAVCPAGDRAYTPWHAQDFQKQGRWYSGTTANVNKAKPGDIVFFDWGASNSIGAIDHVGIVEKALGGGRVQTIEANTSNACLRRVRSASTIAGYGRPAYGSSSGGSASEEDEMGEYVNVGVKDEQDLPPNVWKTVEWGTEYSDPGHNHWDKGGSSVVSGPAKYGLRAYLRLTGLAPGTEGQIRVTAVNVADGSDREPGPIMEFSGSGGDTFVLYSLPIERVGSNRKARIELIQYGATTARIISGNLKANVYPE